MVITGYMPPLARCLTASIASSLDIMAWSPAWVSLVSLGPPSLPLAFVVAFSEFDYYHAELL